MGAAYPELKLESSRIAKCNHAGGRAFRRNPRPRTGTAERRAKTAGLSRQGGMLSGDVAFRLYDTYGFPLDLTQDVLRDDGIEVDVAEFNRLMEEQRERGRAARKDDAVAAGNHTERRTSPRASSDTIATRPSPKSSRPNATATIDVTRRNRRNSLLSRRRRADRRSRRDRVRIRRAT